MTNPNTKIALAVAAVLAAAASAAPQTAAAVTPGKYVAGDFHNHTTCADGSASVQKQIKKATDTLANGGDTPWGLDWYVYATHGNSGGTRNCTLTEDASLDAYSPLTPFVTGVNQQTTWTNSITNAKVYGDQPPGVGPGYMWRWQAYQQYEYPMVEYLAIAHNLPLFVGIELNAAGHEHISTSVINGQMPNSVANGPVNFPPALPITGPRIANTYGNANAMAQFAYCFDVSLADLSRGNAAGLNNPASGPNNNWDCSVPNSANSADPLWNTTGSKLLAQSGGSNGHHVTLEGIKWMQANAPSQSYFVPAHLERPGPFNPNGNNGYNIEHLRDFNNTAPNIAFGFESQPGHGAAAARGEYYQNRNGGFPTTIIPAGTKVDSVGGTTYGGTGVYAAYVGGVWDALLGEGRNWWFFASSDYHSRGSFGNDDRRSTADFFPGEYQRSYTLVRNGTDNRNFGNDDRRSTADVSPTEYRHGTDKIRPQAVVDGLRTGNTWSAQGQLIDRLAFVACAANHSDDERESRSGDDGIDQEAVVRLATKEAFNDADTTGTPGCATMGQKLTVRPGTNIVVALVVRDPAGANYSPYSFPNPSLAQIGIRQPLNQPVLDHVDLIGGKVTGYIDPSSPNYSGQWPVNTDWLQTDGTINPTGYATVPAGMKNTSTAILRTFSNDEGFRPVRAPDGTKYLVMTYRLPRVKDSQYVRARGSNLPPSVPYETDASGNPLSDTYTNAQYPTNLRIPCTVTGTHVPDATVTWTYANGTIDGCPNHLATAPVAVTANGVNIPAGTKMVSYDIAAWSDLWFHSNPIYVEVRGSTMVAGVR